MILYHGTSIAAWENINKHGILADLNKETELDFGFGFYVSRKEDIGYAKAHAKKVAKDAFGRTNLYRNAVVVKMELDETLIDSKLEFQNKDNDFIDFIFNTRMNYKNENLQFDVIVGPMADGAVDYAMSIYRKFPCRLVKCLVKLNYMLPFNNHRQMVIKNQALCNSIQVKEVKNLRGEVLYEQKKEDTSHS